MMAEKKKTVSDSISARTLEDMDKAIRNFKMGDVSPEIDLSDMEEDISCHHELGTSFGRL